MALHAQAFFATHGPAVAGFIALWGASAHAGETALAAFTASGGGRPMAGLVADAQGNLYGTTATGGAGGYGTVFELQKPAAGKTAWTEIVLYSFHGSDGASPVAGLLLSKAGNLYGTTEIGGNVGSCGNATLGGVAYGCGVVFELTPPAQGQAAWSEHVLYAFSGPDGAFPLAGVIMDAEGNLYGTTNQGGAPTYGGEVFELTPPAAGQPAWTETILWGFTYKLDGALPWSGVILDAKGNLYGTTLYGGSYYLGVVYELTPPATAGGAWTQTTLNNFVCTDGAYPASGLVFDAHGNLYGTTMGSVFSSSADYCGSDVDGTVFELSPSSAAVGGWTEHVLHAFSVSDGAMPQAGVVLDAAGAVYGTTSTGGTAPNDLQGGGTVFRLAPPAKGKTAWGLSTLYMFKGGRFGANPVSPLLLSGTELYGTAPYAGAAEFGVAFEVTK
jgi:uncharacterized repeat protein (TIGR03803 family)